jgi:Zn-finger nucleic acid-binding protein
MISGVMRCPRDGSPLISPDNTSKSVFLRNGISHCPTCSGLALNPEAASSEICNQKLEVIHDGFRDEGISVDICCPFCQTGMKVRDFAFRKIDGNLTELIEIDGCPNCASVWLDAGELQRLSPPSGNTDTNPSSEAGALAIVLDLLLHLPLVFV